MLDISHRTNKCTDCNSKKSKRMLNKSTNKNNLTGFTYYITCSQCGKKSSIQSGIIYAVQSWNLRNKRR